MQVFVFRSRKDDFIVGFTTRRGGGNLPEEFAPWALLNKMAMMPNTDVAGVSVGSDAILAGIQQDGFVVARSKI
jgi:hypothetical protein